VSAFVGLASLATDAGAQYSQPMLLEAARDPGRADTPLTSRALALGGARVPSGAADDALANPAGLLLPSRRRQAVGSLGVFRFGRDELAATPPSLPPPMPGRLPSAESVSSTGFAAATIRGSTWAAAGFYDLSQRITHAFSARRQVLRVMAIPGFIGETSGQGSGELELSVLRFGATGAVGLFGGRAAVGMAVYAARVRGTIAGHVDGIERVTFYPPFTPSETSLSWQEDNRVVLSGARPGFALSGLVRAGRHVVVSARWQRDPAFDATRRVIRRNSRDPSADELAEGVEFRLPAVAAASVAVSLGATTIVGEVTRTDYSAAYGPVVDVSPSSSCERQELTSCPGWGFHTYRLRDSTGVRAGLEHGARVAGGLLLVRGGFAFDDAYTLARPATEPFSSAPVPPVPTPFTPPRESRRIWSAGAGYRAGVVDVGFSCAWGSRQSRCLTDIAAGF
jgi:hypothetical protein